jgi:uncharacterized membrane protein YgcG
MAAGEAFSHEQRARIERALTGVAQETGLQFSVRVGSLDDADPQMLAEKLLSGLIAGPNDAIVLILVAPGERVVDILTTPTARLRVSDHAADLAVLSMTSSFGVGDLVGGIIAGLRQLSDAAGPGARPIAFVGASETKAIEGQIVERH